MVGHYCVHQHTYRTPCAVLQLFLFSPFSFLFIYKFPFGPKADVDEFSESPSIQFWTIKIFFFFPPTRRGEREEFVIVIILLGAIPKTSRSARYGRGEKTLALYISVFDYTTQRFWAPDARERPGPPIIKFLFIVCHPEINNKTDFTLFFFSFFLFFPFFFFFFTICIIYYIPLLSEGKRIFSILRACECVYVYVYVYSIYIYLFIYFSF